MVNYTRMTGLLADDHVLCLSAAESDTRATRNPLVFWKEVAHAGRFKKGDRDFEITPSHLRHWRDSFLEMSRVGIDVPVMLEHSLNPERRRGQVLEMAARHNKSGVPALYAKIRFRDAEAAKLSHSGTSIFVPKEVPEKTGRKFPIPVQHIAITDQPVLNGLEGFEPVALSHSGLVLSFPPKQDDKEQKDNKSQPPNSGQQPQSQQQPPNGQQGQQQPPNGQPPQGQPATLQTIAASLGISADQYPDEGQLMQALAQVVAAMRAKLQAQVQQQVTQPQVPGRQQMRPGLNPQRPAIAMSFDESKVNRKKKGEKGGGQFTNVETAGQTLVNQTKITTRAENKAALKKRIQDAYEKRIAKVSSGQFASKGGGTNQELKSLYARLDVSPGAISLEEMLAIEDRIAEIKKNKALKKSSAKIKAAGGKILPTGHVLYPGDKGFDDAHEQERIQTEYHKRQKQLFENIELSQLALSNVPEEIVMSLSKKQFKRLLSQQRELAMAHAWQHDDYEEELDDDLDTDSILGGDDDVHAMTRSLGLSGPVLETVKRARQVQIDQLHKDGLVLAAAKKDLEDRYVNSEAVAFSHEVDDGFEATVKLLKSNGPVINKGKTGAQAHGIVALSRGADGMGEDSETDNPLIRSAAARAKAEASAN